MVDDLQWGVLAESPLEVAEVLTTGPPMEVVSVPTLEVAVGLLLEEAARVEREMGLGEGRWGIAWWD